MREIAARGELDALVSGARLAGDATRARNAGAARVLRSAARGERAAGDLSRDRMRCSACRSPSSGIRKSTPACTRMMVLEQAAQLSDDPVVRFAALDARSRQGHDAARRMAASRRARAARRRARRSDCAIACGFPTPIASSAVLVVALSPAHAHRVAELRAEHAARSAGDVWMRFGARRASSNSCWRAKRTRAAAKDSRIATTRKPEYLRRARARGRERDARALQSASGLRRARRSRRSCATSAAAALEAAQREQTSIAYS